LRVPVGAGRRGAGTISTHATQPDDKPFTCGSLTYTRATLTVLFAWLLWGDVCYTLMESVVPTIVPLKLQELGAPSTLLSLILTTLPAILNLTVCPWVSYRSDRHRSPRGRRIPFILSTMPFLCVSLILMGWSPEIAAWLTERVPALRAVAPASIVIALIGTFMVLFQFFNMFVNSVYWYLFNDVVPAHMLARFTGLFRIVGTGAGALYSGFVLPFGLSHMRQVMTGAAMLYFVGFGLMCLFVREGTYPPPPREDRPRQGPLREFVANFRTYMRESFSNRFYWYFYLSQAFFAMACAGGVFGMFYQLEMGLNLAQIGKLGMVGQVIGMVAVYFAAIFVDRWHPLRVLTYLSIFGAMTGFGGWIWLCMTFPPELYFWMSLGSTFSGVFAGALSGCCLLPAFMRLMPKSRYGQLSSAYAMVRSVATILAGALAGVFMDVLLKLHDGQPFAYRYLFLWFWVFNILTCICYMLAYRQWHRLGGDASYRPPANWEPSGYELANDDKPSVPTSPRLLRLALHLFTGVLVATVAAGPALLYLLRGDAVLTLGLGNFAFTLHLHPMPSAATCLLTLYLPASALTLALWLRLVRTIRRGMSSIAVGAKPPQGLPHHGVLVVLGIQAVFSLLIAWMQFAWLIHIDRPYELSIIGVSVVLGNLATVVAYQVVRWMESGLSLVAPGV
jgi:maltose/moltooligosaccharide transporter